MGYSPWGHTESDTTERLTLSLSPLITERARGIIIKVKCQPSSKQLPKGAGNRDRRCKPQQQRLILFVGWVFLFICGSFCLWGGSFCSGSFFFSFFFFMLFGDQGFKKQALSTTTTNLINKGAKDLNSYFSKNHQ